MSNQEILEKAIQKAIDGGWKQTGGYGNQLYYDDISDIASEYGVDITQSIIFNHDFAKALWGDGPMFDMTHKVQPDNSYKMNVRPAWKVQLQGMVIADDPIKYLGENI